MSNKLIKWLAFIAFILLAILCICNNAKKIESDIRTRSLEAIANIEEFEGNIDIDGRNVTINGTVPLDELKLKMTQLIGSEKGIMKISNNLSVNKRSSISAEKIEEIQKELDAVIQFDNIEFQSNTAIILPSGSLIINKTAKILRDNPYLSIEITGYSDSIGNEEYNFELSKRRADAVLIQLVNRKIDRERLTAIGYGAQNKIADNNTYDGRKINRRVEFKVREEK